MSMWPSYIQHQLAQSVGSIGTGLALMTARFGGVAGPYVILGKNAVNIGQHYFHNEDLGEAKIHIMKIMLTDIHGIIIIMS